MSKHNSSAGIRDTRSLLHDLVARPIDLSPPFHSPARTTTGRRYLGAERDLEHKVYPFLEQRLAYYWSVMSWLQANPSKPELVEALRSSYVWYEWQGSSDVKLANTRQGHRDFLRALVQLKPNTIFLVGPRGSGKTFYLNYLMSTEIDNLYHNKKTLYRAELSKLFDHNAEHPQSEQFTVADYLYGHIAYVTYKYRKRTDLWEIIWRDENLITTTMINVASAAETSGGKSRLVQVAPHQVVPKFKALLDTLSAVPFKDKSDKDFVLRTLLIDLGGEFCRLLGKAIMQITRHEGFTPVLVFDGLDNVEYYKHRKLYDKLLRQIVTLCLNHDDHRNLEGAKVVISLRNETYAHLQKLGRRARFEFGSEKFTIKEHDIAAIISKRSRAAIKPSCEYFRKQRPSDDVYKTDLEGLEPTYRHPCPPSAEAFDQFFDAFAQDYIRNLCRHVKKMVDTSTEVNSSLIMDYCYNWNLRRFIHNFINVFRYTVFFKTRSVVADDRPYLLGEGMLLNGNLYLDSAEDDRSFGATIPNIFWFDQDVAVDTWHGLALYRILQLLHSKWRLKKQQLRKTLHSHFGYHRRIIDQRFDICIKYGLITGKYIPVEQSVIYELTNKGKLFLRYPFLNIDQFYLMALDTPLSEKSVRTSSMIFYHSNYPRFWVNYIEACVLSSITLLRHIRTRHNEEMRELKRDSDTFDLPDIFPGHLIHGLVNHMSTLRRNMSRFKDLHTRLRGLV